MLSCDVTSCARYLFSLLHYSCRDGALGKARLLFIMSNKSSAAERELLSHVEMTGAVDRLCCSAVEDYTQVENEIK